MNYKEIIIWSLTALISSLGVIAFISRVLHIPALSRSIPYLDTINFISALAFFFSGIVLFFSYKLFRKKNNLVAELAVWISLTFMYFFGFFPIVANLFGFQSGLETVFVEDTTTILPSIPCIVSVVAFAVILFCIGMLTLLHTKNLRKWFFRAAIFNASIGIVALIGHILAIPILTYEFLNVSAAMPIPTAMVIIFSSIVMYLMSSIKIGDVL
jgi:hypothetical protein